MIRLKLERLNRGWTQSMVAHLTNMPQPLVSLIETGTWNPAPAQLEALGKVFDMAPERLMREVVPQEMEMRTAASK